MMRIKFFILILALVSQFQVQAQELNVKSMTATNDLSASQYRRNDVTSQPCALVKVLLTTSGATFEGNVIPPVEYKSGEYWVYMSEGSRELRVKHPSFIPLHIRFSDYGINGVQSLVTYDLTLLTQQTQKFIINYSPSTAMVIVDSKVYRGNGRIEVDLPIGEHSYVIAEDGYESVDAIVKLKGGSPRTITESLVRTVPSQIPASSSSVTQSTQKQISSTQKELASEKVHSSSIAATVSTDIERFIVNGVSFNMVRVDGGTFQMGSNDSEAYDCEKPVHKVALSSYSIGETEVTQELWQAVMGSNPSKFKGPNLPVEQVSWDDCQEFLEKLNNLAGHRFRLPTEAEWEFAARGGNKSRGYKYSGSNTIEEVAWYKDNSGDKTHSVKTKLSNELGLYDMSGNVWEWCQDGYGDYSSSAQTNPTGPNNGDYRVSRGCCWGSMKGFGLSYRGGSAPSLCDDIRGLRLAL